jgi:hypothetical protein
MDFAERDDANRFYWDSHWLEIWSNHFCPSMGPNGGSVAISDICFMVMVLATEYTELKRLLSGVHSVMRVKLALAGEGGGCTPTPFITFTITSKVAVYAPAKWADTLTLFHL